jgi:hypothetical protein
MILNFAQALKELGPDAVYKLMRQSKPTDSYYLTGFLPEVMKSSYTVDNATISVIPTMAGLSGMDSPYPEGGVMTATKFLEKTAKITNQVTLSEQALREIQEMGMRMGFGNTTDKMNLVEEVLNFTEKLIIQPHWDTNEFLIGQLFTTGEIDWTFNNLALTVDYGVPNGNKLTARTGNNAYGGSTSKFWEDIRLIQSKLNYDVAALFCHPTTFNEALDNSVNNIEVLEQTTTKYGGVYRIAKLVGSNERRSSDSRDTVTITTYGAAGSLINPADPTSIINKPFLTAGKLVGVGRQNVDGYIPGEGSTDSVNRDRALGYTHVAPTTEGNGQMGRWARVYTPEGQPMQIKGQGVGNVLPVLQAPDKVVIATTDIA